MRRLITLALAVGLLMAVTAAPAQAATYNKETRTIWNPFWDNSVLLTPEDYGTEDSCSAFGSRTGTDLVVKNTTADPMLWFDHLELVSSPVWGDDGYQKKKTIGDNGGYMIVPNDGKWHVVRVTWLDDWFVPHTTKFKTISPWQQDAGMISEGQVTLSLEQDTGGGFIYMKERAYCQTGNQPL